MHKHISNLYRYSPVTKEHRYPLNSYYIATLNRLYKPMETLEEYCIDSQPIDRYEVTEEGYVRLWVSVAVADKDLEYTTDSGDVRIEFISKEDLFDKASLSTAMGKPFSINHPPEPILIENYNRYSVGTSLQEFLEDSGRLVVSGLITNPIAAKKIIDKEIQFTSSAYRATKELTSDGKYKQTKRHYNHFGLLTADQTPRAGIDSTIILDSTNTDKAMTTPKTQTTQPPVTAQNTDSQESPVAVDQPTTASPQDALIEKLFGVVKGLSNKVDSLIPVATPSKIADTVTADSATADSATIDNAKLISDSTSQLVQLWSDWKTTIEQYNKTIDYSLDSSGVKKLVLGCFYNTDTIEKLKDDATLDGFWINFEANKEATKKTAVPNGKTPFNSDSFVEDARTRFIEMTTKKSIKQ